MKGKESCAVVRDLLPLYIHKLTSEETNTVITDHLTLCDDCNTLYKTMTEEINEDEDIKKEMVKEVDYLKKIKKSSIRKILLGVGVVILFFALIVGIKHFFYGSPYDNYMTTITVENDIVTINGELLDSSFAYTHYQITEKDGRNQLLIYASPSFIWNHNSRFKITMSLEEAKELQLVVGDIRFTKTENMVSKRVADVYAKKHPYLRDKPKNSALAFALGIGEDLGSFQNELQTAEKPYGWTLHFQTVLQESNEILFNWKMHRYAYVLLATVDNVGEISWTYTVATKEGSRQETKTLTIREAEEILKENIKTFADSEDRLQQLFTQLGLPVDIKKK